MPPKVVKRGAAAKKANLSSKTAIQNQKQEPEPEPVKNHEENPVADVAAEENSVETVPNGLATVESKSLFLYFFNVFFVVDFVAVM